MTFETSTSESRLRMIWQQERDQLAEIVARVDRGDSIQDHVSDFLKLRKEAESLERPGGDLNLSETLQLQRQEQRVAIEKTLAAIDRATQRHSQALDQVVEELGKSNAMRRVLATYRQQ